MALKLVAWLPPEVANGKGHALFVVGVIASWYGPTVVRKVDAIAVVNVTLLEIRFSISGMSAR